MTIPSSILSGCTNPELFERMYALYMADPMSVDPSWRDLFDQIEKGVSTGQQTTSSFSFSKSGEESSSAKIAALIEAYRRYGHLLAKVNPLHPDAVEEPEELNLGHLGFNPEDLDKVYPVDQLTWSSSGKLSDIISALRKIYCSRLGIEYMDTQDSALQHWLQQQIEPSLFSPHLDIDHKQSILQHLNRSELLEVFLHTKYPGQKRFSLEGAESLIPMIAHIIDEGANMGVRQVILGMAHRGRLNVLANILEKSYGDIFAEFDPHYIPNSMEGSGDVKYHKGFAADRISRQGHKVHLELMPNPSHLEAVAPVVEGQARARQEMRGGDMAKEEIIPLLIHGDAALAGQGIVYETLQMAHLEGYSTGGTLHIIINNQIGFTTVPEDGRSTRYCSDIAKTFGAPVFHVNAEDPEECIYATHLALQMRQKFGCDVFIDLVCYRKYGHNESDEPAFTQPLEYQVIRNKKPIRELYRDKLIQQGILEKALAEELEAEFKESLQKALQGSKEIVENNHTLPNKEEKNNSGSRDKLFNPVETGVPLEKLKELAHSFCSLPPDFNPHAKLKDLLTERLKMIEANPQEKTINWGMGEMLAYATILAEKKHIRISGQDCGRGTFSHRHALLVDQKEEKNYIPLNFMMPEQGRFDIYNSPLSEYGVLGFEYGYSMAYEKALVVWEAQFGDFCNGAQVIIDQFITTSEQKWGKKVGLVLLLPHGYEGQGPEHSSARVERFLSLAGDDNIQVVNASTPAQLFHLLRRQVERKFVKPLIIFTPKALLRHASCLSAPEEFAKGSFQEVIDDPQGNKQAKRIAFCTGKIYYEMEALRKEKKDQQLALIRIEQLYPLHETKLKELIDSYTAAEEYLWIQEEPSNMGAWNYISPQLQHLLPEGKELQYVGRERSASPATGSYAIHQQEHSKIVEKVFI